MLLWRIASIAYFRLELRRVNKRRLELSAGLTRWTLNPPEEAPRHTRMMMVHVLYDGLRLSNNRAEQLRRKIRQLEKE